MAVRPHLIALVVLLGSSVACSSVPGPGNAEDDASEGELRDEVTSSKYDLEAYAFVTGLVGANEEATELYETLKSSGKTTGDLAYAGLTARELGIHEGDAEDDGNVVGVSCTPASGGSEYSFASCTLVAVVRTADVRAIKEGAVQVTIRGRVAVAMQKMIPPSGLGALKCVAGAAGAAACTGPVLGAAPTFDTLVNTSDMKVGDAEKIIAAAAL